MIRSIRGILGQPESVPYDLAYPMARPVLGDPFRGQAHILVQTLQQHMLSSFVGDQAAGDRFRLAVLLALGIHYPEQAN